MVNRALMDMVSIPSILFLLFLLIFWAGFRLAKFISTHPEGKKEALSDISDNISRFSKKLDRETHKVKQQRELNQNQNQYRERQEDIKRPKLSKDDLSSLIPSTLRSHFYERP